MENIREPTQEIDRFTISVSLCREPTHERTKFSASVSLCKDDYIMLKSLAKEHGMKVSDFICSCIEIVEGVTFRKEIRWK